MPQQALCLLPSEDQPVFERSPFLDAHSLHGIRPPCQHHVQDVLDAVFAEQPLFFIVVQGSAEGNKAPRFVGMARLPLLNEIRRFVRDASLAALFGFPLFIQII